MNKALLLSVRAHFAEMIFEGTKTFELRRRQPKVQRGDYLIIYVPAPFKRIAGIVAVDDVIEARVPTLWRRVRLNCGIAYRDFLSYFSGLSVGFGIVLTRPARLASPVPLEALRALEPGFSPQGYKYLSRDDITDALVRLRPYAGRRDQRIPS
ncbi:MAG: ASCH domain-containing protein [Phycisphaerae bacterium]|nr:ASCH domain-containing protein [Phycisphaerae bacterium]